VAKVFFRGKGIAKVYLRTLKYHFQTYSCNILPPLVGCFCHHIKIFSHHGSDNFEKLKFENFQDALSSDSKISRPCLVFQNFPNRGKNRIKISKTFKDE